LNTFDKFIDASGVITTKNVVSNNQSKTDYYNYLKSNDFEQISRGIYALKDTFVDSLLIAHMRCPSAVISHDTALNYYGLIDREPLSTTFTIYSGYNVTKLKTAGYKVFFVKKEYLELGKTDVVDFDGNTIPMYDLERTMCDLLRNRSSFEVQDFNTALRTYARRKDKNLNRLFEYAKALRVEKMMRTYMEVLL